MMTHKKDERTSIRRKGNTMQRTRQGSMGRLCRWVLMAGTLGAATMFLANSAIAGPKGTITVRPLGNLKLTVDADLSDWPLDKFTAVSEQPVFPDGQNRDTTSASGDHLVFDPTRVGLFNGTAADAFKANNSDFGASMYFAYDANFLYILGVFIDDVLRDDLDVSDHGSTGYLNDGFEFFLDAKGDSTDCIAEDAFPNIDEGAPNSDDFQVTVGLNKNFKPSGSADDVLGARQALARQGNPALIGDDGPGAAGGIYQDALTAIGGPDIAAKSYADLRAAGAKNPEIVANPNVKFSGYVVEMRVPFSSKIDGFKPDHTMGFDLFWRDVDTDGVIKWADWGQSTTVGSCSDAKADLFNSANWGVLSFDTTNFLGSAPQ
jgi:hypothetical protein